MNWISHNYDGFSLKLPEQKLGDISNESDYYGARKTLCDYAGVDSKSYSLEKIWQHGWIRDRLLIDPAIVLASKHSNKKEASFLVANKQQEDFLKYHGYPKVRAAGMPIIYTKKPEPELKRLPNSLLVMPMHSLESTKRKSNFEDYAALVNELRQGFDFVLVCLHYSCIRNNFWMREFDAHNISWIEGANIYDENCFMRLQALFSSFEYVTTNGYGSHLPYSTYFGAKTSIYGEFPPRKPKDYVNDPFFKKFPHLLNTYFPLLEEEVIKKDLPFLFCHPKEAIQHTAWGAKELGEDYKLSKVQARKILVHNTIKKIRSTLIDLPRQKLSRYASKIFKH